MFKIVKVVGESMADEYLDGDFVLILKSPFFKYLIKQGRDVVFYRAPHGIMIKRIIKVDRESRTVDLSGINEKSISKEVLKSVHYDDILGVVIKKLK